MKELLIDLGVLACNRGRVGNWSVPIRSSWG